MENKHNNENEQKEDFDILGDLLNKQIELEKLKQKRTPIWKNITYFFVGVASIGFLGFCCYMMYKQSFTMETLLAVLLSFFSIGLSIMFYIQSEKSSSAYYTRSYEIMKEVSVTLGKIESSFGEKLANINSSLENFKHQKEEMKNKIEQGEEEQKNLATKIAKEKSEEQRIALVQELQEKTRETEMLKIELDRLERMRHRVMKENIMIREKMHDQENIINDLMNNKNFRNYIMHSPSSDNSDI